MWSVPKLWPDSTVFILGGGPSVNDLDVSRLRDQRVIAVNSSFLIAPWADCLAFGDSAWLTWNRAKLHLHTGPFKVTWAGIAATITGLNVHVLGRDRRSALSTDPRLVAGSNSGHGAVNLAVHFGARRIVLLGFDMKPSKDGQNNWHTYHPRPTPPSRYAVFIAEMERAAPLLEGLGIEVLNCCPDSALTCFPVVGFDEALREPLRTLDGVLSTLST